MVLHQIISLARDEKRMVELELEVAALNRVVETLYKQIQEQEREMDVVIRANQYLEYLAREY
jgi:uncharacterized coiled-coil protein SlyX